MSKSTPEKFEFVITLDHEGQRIDKALATHPSIGTRSRATKLLDEGHVRLNGKVPKASYMPRAGEKFEVTIPAVTEVDNLAPLKMDLDILHEDSDLLVVNKPAGLVVHPAAGHANDTLVNALVHHAKDLAMGFGEERPGIVHRLDKDTSGILVIAKNDATQAGLVDQFRARTTHRLYWAIVHGTPKQGQGRIETYLARHPTDRKKFASHRPRVGEEQKGKKAITHYSVKERHECGLSLLHCRLETGRTHQIRVHLSEQSLPIIGDWLYGAGGRLSGIKSEELRAQIQAFTRIGLHAAELGFVHPKTKEPMKFSAPWPADLINVVSALGWK